MADGEHLKIRVGVEKNSINTSAATIKSAFLKLGGTIAAAFSVKAFADFAKSSIELASDVEEVQNVVDVSFGDMRDQMEAFADKAIETYGISRLTAKRTGSTYMAMAKGMGIAGQQGADMALTLTGLSADMASFYNVSQKYTDIALKSVFTGETETLKQYGIVMTQTNLQEFARQKGITKSIQSMTQQEQTMLRYQYVMKQTQLAQGDFARTQDSWANQTRILSERWDEVKIQFGETFKVLATLLLPTINSALTVMSQVAQVLQQAMRNIGLMSGRQVDTTSKTADNISEAAESQQDLAKATKEANKAAKDQVAGFDEVNQITKDTAESAEISAGSGLGGTLGVSEATSTSEDLKQEVSATLTAILEIVGFALIAIGVLLLCFGKIGWGIGFIIAGAALFSVAEFGLHDFKNDKIQSTIDAIIKILATGMVVLGIILAVFGGPAVLPVAIALIVGGAVIFVTKTILGSDSVSEPVKNLITYLLGIMSGAALVLGIILCVSQNYPLGIALIALGVVGLFSVGATHKDSILNWIKEVWGKIKDFWKTHIGKYFKADFWNKTFGVIKTAFKSVLNGIIGFANLWIKGLNTLLTPIRLVVYGAAKAFGKDVKFSDVKIPYIPKLAKGAVLPANKPFLAQLGDQRNGRNLETPESLLREIYSEQNAPVVSLLRELIEVEKSNRTMVANGREIARTVNEANNSMGTNIASGAFAYVR